jgi:hypothetical protein
MSGNTVIKFKWFWDDADHAIESWLQDMARQGLHLKRVSCLRTVFVFERGAPADVTYRVDFLLMRADPHYLQLFKDAGWEHVDQLLGWQYWRAPTRAGRATEIFTDIPSMIKKYQRVLWLFLAAWLPTVLLTPFNYGKGVYSSPTFLWSLAGLIGLTLYAVVRLLLRIRKLRAQAPS